MDLAEMRALVRRDLHDEDSGSYRWTDDEIARHISRAVREFSVAVPLESKATLTTAPGSRDLSIASLADRVSLDAVEYPVGSYPPSYASFSIWGDTLTLLVDSPPLSAVDVYVYYGRLHTLDLSGSTVPAAFEEVVATGAAGYAALEWASFATNRLNAGGAEVWRDYLTWGQERLASFAGALAHHGRRARLHPRRLFVPALSPDIQGTDLPG